MLRIPGVICKTRTCILRIRNNPDIQLQSQAPLSITPISYNYKRISDKERDTCPKKPLVCPPPRDITLVWGTFAALIMTGAFAVYAKKNPEVRDWLSIQLPWFDDFIAVLYQENMSYIQFIMCCMNEFQEQIINFYESCIAKKEDKKKENVPQACEAVKEEEDESVDDSLTPEQSACDELQPPLIIKDICEIEECMRDLGETAYNNYFTAKEACVYYNNLVFETMGALTFPKLKKLLKEKETRMELIEKHIPKAEEAEKLLGQVEEEMNRAIECNVAVKKSPEKVARTKEALKDLKTKIEIVKADYQWAVERSTGSDEIWQTVETLVDRFADDISAVYPGLNYCEERPKLKGDLDFLLEHSRRWVKKIHQELQVQAESMSERVNRAVDLLPQKEKDKLKAAHTKKLAEQMKVENDILTVMKENTEKETKRLMKAAEDKHVKDLARKLEEKEKEVMIKFTRMVAEAVAKQKQIFNDQLKEMSIKLAAVRVKFNERIKADRERNRSRALYEASSAILAKCKKGDPIVNVAKEIDSIEKNRGFCDDLVASVLKAIPETARSKGIVPESTLRERYKQMESVAMKVSMAEGDGSPLPIYGISLLQATLLFMKPSNIPQKEKDNPPEEPFEGMDTFDLLQRARYYMELGNLAQAAKYVGALQGASRGAASTWYDDTKIHLETRQAAEAVMAHAAALGLKYM